MIHLQSGPLACDIEPRLGACLAGLWLDGTSVLRPVAAAGLTSARDAGCYPLVPFANRIAQPKLQWQGTLYPLVRNDGTEAHAVHGIGWQRSWELLDSNEQFAMLSYEHQPDASWPFAFDCSQTIRLRDQTLEMTLSLTNQSPGPAPAGLGWHPLFVKRPRGRITFSTTGRWEAGEDRLPARRVACEGVDAEIASLQMDHCFDGWDGVARLRDERVSIRIASNLSRLVVFASAGGDSVAVEPVSHVNDAIALVAAGADAASLGLVTLAPGDSMNAHMSITVEHSGTGH